jgi:putative endonuclease
MLGGVKAGHVYVMASERNGTLYIGVTSDRLKRAWEHRNGFWKLSEIEQMNPEWQDLYPTLF